MGILTGKAKAPSQPVQPYTPPPVVVAPTPEPDPAVIEAEAAAAARTQSLLRRSRSRFGTILTGFKGFLSPSDGAGNTARKTLLGE